VNDRIKFANGKRKQHVTDIMLSRQSLINCGKKRGGFGDGCNGGEAFDVLEYMRRFGLPDETCQNYLAHDEECSPEHSCTNCMYIEGDLEPHCWAVPENQTVRYYVKEYGFVNGEAAIMDEVFHNGPVVCGMTAPDSFTYGYHGGVWEDLTNSSDIDHDVEIAGWGEEHGVKYWLVRNSWGSYWGEQGWFKVRRGINNMHIEEQCATAVVDVHELDEVVDGRRVGSMFGVIPRASTPQYFPNRWIKGWPHEWVHGSIKEAIRAETENVKLLDHVAQLQGLKQPVHVPHDVRVLAKTIGMQETTTHTQVDMAAIIPGSGLPVPSDPAGPPGGVLVAIGVVLGVAVSAAAALLYNKFNARHAATYASIE